MWLSDTAARILEEMFDIPKQEATWSTPYEFIEAYKERLEAEIEKARTELDSLPFEAGTTGRRRTRKQVEVRSEGGDD